MRRTLASFLTHTVAARLFVGFVLFALPVAVLLGQIVHWHADRITFAQRELQGARLLPTLLQTHGAIFDAASDLAAGRPVRPQFERAQLELAQTRTRPDHFDGVDADIEALQARMARIAALEAYDPLVVRAAADASNDLIRAVGEQSNLMLDPELDSFYLMELSVLRAALLLERVGYLGNSAVGLTPQTDGRGMVIAAHTGRLEIALAEFRRSAEAAIRFERHPDVASEMQVQFQQVVTYTALLRSAASSSADPATAERASQAARTTVLQMAVRSVMVLEDNLDRRIERLEREMWRSVGLAVSLFALALAVVLWLVQHGLVLPLQRLTGAMRGVADGDLAGELPVGAAEQARADELGDMARALSVFRQTAIDRIAADEAARARAEFLAVMSHEIRTPLNGVLGMTQALAATRLDPGQRRMVDVVLDSGGTLLTLLNDILDFSKIEAGRLELEHVAFDPASILNSASDLFDARATAKGLLLRVEPAPPGTGWRMSDPQRLRQVVFNLVSNAIKFTETGTVRLWIEASDQDRLRIVVSDTGIGIPPERQDRLFARFTQTEASHARIYGGTGLGLAITKALVEAMDGSIQVNSAPGQGSTFIVDIAAPAAEQPQPIEALTALMPLEPDGTRARSEAGDAGDASIPGEALSVLVAEDNATNRLVIGTLLGQIGIAPDFTEDGYAAFQAWQAKTYDVVLMDMQMPVWDGLQSMRAMRRAEAETGRPRTAIVALTADAMAHQIEEQRAAGADSHAAKPIQLTQLLAAIDIALEAAGADGDAAADGADGADGAAPAAA